MSLVLMCHQEGCKKISLITVQPLCMGNLEIDPSAYEWSERGSISLAISPTFQQFPKHIGTLEKADLVVSLCAAHVLQIQAGT